MPDAGVVCCGVCGWFQARPHACRVPPKIAFARRRPSQPVTRLCPGAQAVTQLLPSSDEHVVCVKCEHRFPCRIYELTASDVAQLRQLYTRSQLLEEAPTHLSRGSVLRSYDARWIKGCGPLSARACASRVLSQHLWRRVAACAAGRRNGSTRSESRRAMAAS